MKTRIALVIVAIVAVGLAIGLIKTNQDATKDHKVLTDQVTDFSNQWGNATVQVEEQKQKNLQLTAMVSNQDDSISKLSNSLASANDTITQREAALKAAQDDLSRRQSQIEELTATTNRLEQDVTSLSNQISTLNTKIADTQSKLDKSEGDRVALMKDLDRLMAEKAELERRFNDLAVLKDQVRKLKEDMDVSRRLEWIRQGLYAADQKGGQKLMQGTMASASTRPGSTNMYDLNVEVHTDGSVQVIPPISRPATP